MSSSVDSDRGRPADVVVSVVLLVLAWVLLLCGAVVGLLSLAFLDHCPPESCSTDDAVDAVFLGGGLALALVIALSVLGVVRMFMKRSTWWVALLAILAVAAGAALGVLRYADAVG